MAALNNPTGIAVDPSGSIIYVSDVGSNRIRKISAGSIQTVAGCVYTRQTNSANLAQNCSFTADGLPATILKLNLSGATTQNTKRFSGVAVDASGTVYFAESGSQVVRKVTGGTVVTIAGQLGTSGLGGDGGPAVNMFLSSPEGVAVDSNGNVFVAEKANFAAHMISGANGIVYPLAGQVGANTNAAETANNVGGVAVPAWGHRYRAIQGVAVDNGGNVFLADSSNNKIDRIPYAAPATCDPAVTKTCPANSSQWVDYRVAGNLANTAGDFVFDYAPTTSATAVASTAQLSFPVGVAVDSKGQVIFADCANNLIRVAVPPAPAKP
jgi:filamentous hemagglutinin family protein